MEYIVRVIVVGQWLARAHWPLPLVRVNRVKVWALLTAGVPWALAGFLRCCKIDLSYNVLLLANICKHQFRSMPMSFLLLPNFGWIYKFIATNRLQEKTIQFRHIFSVYLLDWKLQLVSVISCLNTCKLLLLSSKWHAEDYVTGFHNLGQF